MEFGFEVFRNSILLIIIGSKSRNVIVFLGFFSNTFQNGAKPIPNQGVLRKNRKCCVLPFLKAKRSVFLGESAGFAPWFKRASSMKEGVLKKPLLCFETGFEKTFAK